MIRLTRRGFVWRVGDVAVFLAGSSTIGGCGVVPQSGARSRQIGVLVATDRVSMRENLEALLDGLRQLGWVDDRNLLINWREGGGNLDRYTEISAELVKQRVEALVVTSSGLIEAASNATNTIPIVIAGVTYDPVERGMAASLARPGGNVTGTVSVVLNDKRVELLRQVVSTHSGRDPVEREP